MYGFAFSELVLFLSYCLPRVLLRSSPRCDTARPSLNLRENAIFFRFFEDDFRYFESHSQLSGQGCPHIGYFAATALDEDYTQCVCTLALSWLLEARSRLRYQGLLNILREKVAAREVVGQRGLRCS